jgi:hypothetical protein
MDSTANASVRREAPREGLLRANEEDREVPGLLRELRGHVFARELLEREP